MNHKIDLDHLYQNIQEMQRDTNISASKVPYDDFGPWRRVEWMGSDGRRYSHLIQDTYTMDGSVSTVYGVDCQWTTLDRC